MRYAMHLSQQSQSTTHPVSFAEVIDECQTRTRNILTYREPLVQSIATALVEHTQLDQNEFLTLINTHLASEGGAS